MKRCIEFMILIFASLLVLPVCGSGDFDIILKSKWRDLNGSGKKIVDDADKWVLVGSITFKRGKDPICIDSITLHWNGENMDNLVGSLYRKTPGKEFLAIEENLICDGAWNKNKQTLILNFDEAESLEPTAVFYLVLTIPESIEPLLKQGSFSLEDHCLPRPFKNCAHNEKLLLVINNNPTKLISSEKVN